MVSAAQNSSKIRYMIINQVLIFFCGVLKTVKTFPTFVYEEIHKISVRLDRHCRTWIILVKFPFERIFFWMELDSVEWIPVQTQIFFIRINKVYRYSTGDWLLLRFNTSTKTKKGFIIFACYVTFLNTSWSPNSRNSTMIFLAICIPTPCKL